MAVRVKKPKVVEEPQHRTVRKNQRLVAARNVEKLKAAGWKVIKKPVDKHGRELGVKTHLEDLTLMEK